MSNNENWRRLSPYAIAYFTGKSFMQALNMLPVFAAGLVAVLQIHWGLLPLCLLAALIVMVLFSTLYYLNFYYIQKSDRFLIREGILSRNRLEIPFNKIQNVNTKQPFYFRPLGLVVLTIDSAGSAQKEVEIAALAVEDAARIRETIKVYRSEALVAQSPSSGSSSSVDDALPILERSTKDIVIHGVTNNRAWFLLAFAAPLLAQVDSFMPVLLERLGWDVGGWVASVSVIWLTMMAIVLLLAVFFLVSMISVLGSVLALFNFKLFYSDGTYTRKSGLINRYEVQVKQSRIQTLMYIQTGLDMLFSRSCVTLEPFSGSANEQIRSNFLQKIMVPSLTEKEAGGLLAHVYEDLDLSAVQFKPISFHYLIRKMWVTALPVSLIVLILLMDLKGLAILLMCTVFTAIMLLFWLRWLRYGVTSYRGYILVRSGFIGTTIYCLPIVKIQQIKYLQSIFLQRRNLASVQLISSSRSITLPFIPVHYAERLTDYALAKVEFSKESWM